MQPSTECTLVGLGPDAPTGVDAPTIAAVGAECFFVAASRFKVADKAHSGLTDR